MHFEFNRKNYTFGTPTNVTFTQADHVGDLVRIGVNYRFIFEPEIAPPLAVIAKY